jgi:hypothetical protein
MKRYIRLGNGRRVTLGSYVAAWRATKALPMYARTRNNPDDPDDWCSASEALDAYRRAMHVRINARGDLDGHGTWRGKIGRKHSEEWQLQCRRAAYRVNSRNRVRPADLPPEYVKRLAHCLR